MKLFVGLGNPDQKYQKTRHNLGAMLIGEIASDFKNYPKLDAKIAKVGDNLYAILNTYMNCSGPSVQKILNFFKIDPKDLYVIHDDLDLAVGEWKAQFDRSSAGHNGVQSIMDSLDTQAFNRYRIGIGKPTNNIPIEDYVLQYFSVEEADIICAKLSEIIKDIKNQGS